MLTCTQPVNILLVDEAASCLNAMVRFFLSDRHEITCVREQKEAIKTLLYDPDHFDLIILDDGLSAKNLKVIKNHPKLKHIPVVLQKTEDDEVEMCRLSVRTLYDAKAAAFYLSNFYPEPERVLLGIHEIIINAVEHGNLGISYYEKSDLIESGRWMEEVEERLTQEHFMYKEVEIEFLIDNSEIKLRVKDQGEGFNWNEYMEISGVRARDKHGRGIALSKELSFDRLHYMGCGNEVNCVVELN